MPKSDKQPRAVRRREAQNQPTRPAGLNPGFDGMEAKRAGLPVETCPYEKPGPQRTAWVVGWYIAERDQHAD